MKIRHKLTLQFSIIVASIVLFFSLITYALYADFRKEEFYHRIKSKAETVAEFQTEVPQKDGDMLEVIDSKSINRFYKEKIVIFNQQNQIVYSSLGEETVFYNPSLLSKIRYKKYIEYTEKENEVVGLYYERNGCHDVVIASAYDKSGRRKLENLRDILVGGSLISVLLTVIAGMFFAGKAIDPISEINDQVSSITARSLSMRVKTLNSKDEIDQLAQNFNKMLDRLQHAFIMKRSFINNASHELRTPLAVMSSQLDITLSQKRENSDYERILVSLQEDVRKMTNLINTMFVLAKSEEEQEEMIKGHIRIDELMLSVKDELTQAHSKYGVDFSYISVPENDLYMTVKGHEFLLRSAFMNLLENACKFSQDHQVKVLINSDDRDLTLYILDNGIGIPEKDISRIFDPFYRAENGRQEKGFGIGLSICKRAFDLHRAQVSIDSEINNGTRFTIRFRHV